ASKLRYTQFINTETSPRFRNPGLLPIKIEVCSIHQEYVFMTLIQPRSQQDLNLHLVSKPDCSVCIPISPCVYRLYLSTVTITARAQFRNRYNIWMLPCLPSHM